MHPPRQHRPPGMRHAPSPTAPPTGHASCTLPDSTSHRACVMHPPRQHRPPGMRHAPSPTAPPTGHASCTLPDSTAHRPSFPVQPCKSCAGHAFSWDVRRVCIRDGLLPVSRQDSRRVSWVTHKLPLEECQKDTGGRLSAPLLEFKLLPAFFTLAFFLAGLADQKDPADCLAHWTHSGGGISRSGPDNLLGFSTPHDHGIHFRSIKSSFFTGAGSCRDPLAGRAGRRRCPTRSEPRPCPP